MSTSGELEWFHVILTTYGAWLPGDPRGFRTRDHRDHVEGDYKHPPEAGLYTGLHRAARTLQREPTVTFPPDVRPRVSHLIAGRIVSLESLFAIIAVAGQHAHLLVKLPPKLTRHWGGMIKRHVTFELKETGWTGKVWGGQAKFIPINNRGHQLNAYSYIGDHVREGAAVLTWREWCARQGRDSLM